MPFQKGKSGNPAGRPKGESALSESLRKRIENPAIRNAIIEALIAKARDGDLAATKLILDRLEGTAPTSADVTIRTPTIIYFDPKDAAP